MVLQRVHEPPREAPRQKERDGEPDIRGRRSDRSQGRIPTRHLLLHGGVILRGMRLDLAAARAFGLSRRAAREAVRAGRIDVDGSTRDEPGAEVAEPAALTFHPDRPPQRSVRTSLKVLHEDADCIVVEKQAGLLSLPTADRERTRSPGFPVPPASLQAPAVRASFTGSTRTRPSTRFRAKPRSARALQKSSSSTRSSEYVALVEAVPDSARRRSRARPRRSPPWMARPGERGLSAVTRYKIVERLGRASLVGPPRNRAHAPDPGAFCSRRPSRSGRRGVRRSRESSRVESPLGIAAGASADAARAAPRLHPAADRSSFVARQRFRRTSKVLAQPGRKRAPRPKPGR